MLPGFFMALLLCTGDNCDLVRLAPAAYTSYEACSGAAATEAANLTPLVAALAPHEDGERREGQVLCLRDMSGVVEHISSRADRSPPQASAMPAPARRWTVWLAN
jgi:hypothetical protein